MRINRLVFAMVTLALATSPLLAQHHLVFVSEKTASTGGASPLDTFSDEELISLAFTPQPQARKLVSDGMWNAVLGDENQDGNFFQDIFDEIDAVETLPGSPSDPTLYDFVLSSQDDFGIAWTPSVDNGGLFRLRRPLVLVGDSPFEIFLSELVLQNGLGTSSGIDIDGVAFTSNGTILLSLASDELILGDVVPIGNGAVVAFEPASITYDPRGNISNLGINTAVIVVSEAAIDTMVAAAGLLDELGLPVNTIGNLQSLETDPLGGTFTGEGSRSWPNLLISGSTTGPRILTTSGGGNIATLDGNPLGEANSPDPGALGLDGSPSDEADISSITVIASRDVPLALDLEKGGLSPSNLSDTLSIGNATPFGTGALMLVRAFLAPPGSNFGALAVSGFRYPGLYTFPFNFTLSLSGFDVEGRKSFAFAFPPGIAVDIEVLFQVVDITAPLELSAPIVVFYDAQGV